MFAMLHFKHNTSTTLAFVCLLHNLVDHNFSLGYYKVERVIAGRACTCMHALYKIREFLSYKGFNLIKVYFSVHYSAMMYMLSFVPMPGDTSGSSGCEILIRHPL